MPARRSGTATLDEGGGIDARSLALDADGTRVYWTREGAARSALV